MPTTHRKKEATMVKESNYWQNVFSIGYACACAEIIRTHGEYTLAKDVFRGNFMSVETMKKIGVDENDIEVLLPIVKELEETKGGNNG